LQHEREETLQKFIDKERTALAKKVQDQLVGRQTPGYKIIETQGQSSGFRRSVLSLLGSMAEAIREWDGDMGCHSWIGRREI
jgi:hypothetical protein